MEWGRSSFLNCATFIPVFSKYQCFYSCSQELGVYPGKLRILQQQVTPRHIPTRPLRTWPYKCFRNHSILSFPQRKTKCWRLKDCVCVCVCVYCLPSKKIFKLRQKPGKTPATPPQIAISWRKGWIFLLLKPSNFSARSSSSLYFWSSRYSWEKGRG